MHHLIVASCYLLCQVQVKETAGPFPGQKGLTSNTQLYLTTLLLSFLKKNLILTQSTGRTLFQKYISMSLQLIGLPFAMSWIWMLVLEGEKTLILNFLQWACWYFTSYDHVFQCLNALFWSHEIFCPLFSWIVRLFISFSPVVGFESLYIGPSVLVFTIPYMVAFLLKSTFHFV